MKRSIFYSAVSIAALCLLAFAQNPFRITSPLPPIFVAEFPLPNLPAADLCTPSSIVICTPYSFTFTSNAGQQGVDGTPPIRWSVQSGGGFPSGLALPPLDASNTNSIQCPSDPFALACTILTGTPATADITGPQGRTVGTVIATDSSAQGVTASIETVMDVNPQPAFNSFFPTALPNGIQGRAYTPVDLSTANVSVVRAGVSTISGGTPPFTWSAAPTSLPAGFNLSPAGVLSGTPTGFGTFNVTIQATDSAGGTSGATTIITTLPLTIIPALVITSPSTLPPVQINIPYTLTFTAAGGIPLYVWTPGSSPPSGLNLSVGGVLSGTPTATGTFPFTVVVNDQSGQTASAPFTLTILPPVPTVTITVPPSGPNDQPHAQISLASPYSLDITGEATLSFVSDVGKDDGIVQFINGTRTLNFTIPAGATMADATFMTGTTAGTVTLTVTSLNSGERAVTQLPAPGRVVIPAAAPVLMAPAAATVGAVTATRSGGALTVAVSGFCTARQITGAVFQFAGTNLTSTRPLPTLDVSSSFSSWYQDPASIGTGTAFTYVQPFSIQGNPDNVTSVTVTLIGPPGQSQPMTVQIQQQ